MELNNKQLSLVGFGALTLSCLLALVSHSLLAQERTVAQKNTAAQKTADDKKYLQINDKTLNAEPVQVVREYWRLAEAGDLKEAAKLKTNQHRDYGLELKGDPKIKEWEERIYNAGDSLKAVEDIEVIDYDEWEITVRVKRKTGKDYYLFHTLIKNGDEWGIFLTSR